ncbi:MAG: methyltransferase domain-containing protein [Candidatus Hinthialibacter antarcticus]|nr:methyltransferase domain-containing protein [Candidatus Hinthialibacter antarcticus]
MYKPAFYHWTDAERAAKSQHAEIARLTGLGATGRLLEIGSGDGAYLEYFQNHGWECLGVEDDESYTNDWMNKNVLTLQGRLDEVGLPANSYDLVRIRGALGGEKKLGESLRILFDAIHSTGYLIAEVWNGSGFPSRPEDDCPVNQFSKASLHQYLERAGFDVGGIIAPSLGDEIWTPLKQEPAKGRTLISKVTERTFGLFDRGSLLVAFAQKPPR